MLRRKIRITVTIVPGKTFFEMINTSDLFSLVIEAEKYIEAIQITKNVVLKSEMYEYFLEFHEDYQQIYWSNSWFKSTNCYSSDQTSY
jgi:hypothetical protein